MESVVVGFKFETKFRLPTNNSHYWAHLANLNSYGDSERSIGKRSLVKKEIVNSAIDYEDEQGYNEDNKNTLGSMRWIVYKALAQIAER